MSTVLLKLILCIAVRCTAEERQALRAELRAERSSFCSRHLISDMPPELEELERQLDEERDAEWRERNEK